MDKLGEVFVEILGDADPFAESFGEVINEAGGMAGDALSEAMTEASGAASEELVTGMEGAGERLVDVMTEASGAASEELVAGMGEAGTEGGDALTEGLEGAADSVDLSGLSDAAAGAADSASAALAGIDADIAIDPDFSSLIDEATGAAEEVSAALSEVDADIDVDADFSSIVGEAESAADDIAGAFADVGATIEDSLSGAGGAMSGLTDSLGSVQGALGTAAGGAGLEGFARAQAPMTEQSDRLASSLGMSSDAIRDLALESGNVTRPLDQVLETMEIGRQQGLRSEEQLMNFVAAWDTVGDATGANADQLAKLSPSLKAVGVEADNIEGAFSALGYITENTTIGVDDFMNIINRMGPDLREMNMDVDDTAGLLGAMQGELGLTGRTARTEFSAAVNSADGDMATMLETLGLSEEQLAQYTSEVADSSDVIMRNADIHAESYTPIQKLQHGLSELSYEFGGVGDAAALVAAPLGAIGPSMLAMNQTQQLLSSGMGTKLVGGLKAAAGGFKTLATAIFTNPLFLIGAVIIGLIYIIWKFRDEIIGALKAAWDWVAEKTAALWSWFTEAAGNAVNAVVEWFTGLKDRAVEVVQQLVDWIVEHHPLAIMARLAAEWVPRIWEWLTSMATRAVEIVAEWVANVVGFVTDLWTRWSALMSAIRDAVVEVVVELVASVVTTVQGWVESIVGFVTDLWSRWVGLVHDIRDAVWGAVDWLVSRVVTTISGWVEDVIGFVRDLSSRFTSGISGMIDRVLGYFRDLPGRVVRNLGSLATTLVSSGKDLIRGLWNGVRAMGSWLRDRLVSFVADRIPGPIARALGIASPSTVFAEFGRNLIEGLELGVEQEAAGALRTIEDFANDVSSAGNMGALFNEDELRAVGSQRAAVRPEEADPALAGVGSRGGDSRMEVVQNIYTVNPAKAGREAIRELRDLAYLSAPFPTGGGDEGAPRVP